MIVVVTGGREYSDRDNVYGTLDEIHNETPISVLVHGACYKGGADILAEDWAKSREVPYFGVPAKWKTGTKGKGEGNARNQRMLDLAKPALVVPFPGGSGTADCVKEAKKRGIKIYGD